MSSYILENACLKITLKTAGAELTSVTDKINKTEYLWSGDETYWSRQSPVLFPFVGSLKNKEFNFEGQTYEMGQHGFARDMEFTMLSQTKDTIFFRLNSNENTKKNYPFDFILDVGYVLKERSLRVLWKVHNPSDNTMHFSIGAHPAFMCPLNSRDAQTDYFIDFHTDKNVFYNLVDRNNGLVAIYDQELELENGILPITATLFDNDALIVENGQTNKVSLLDKEKNPYVSVTFDTPLFGIWSPAQKNAPFICIEPWYGRCDSSDFNGTLEEREYSNQLQGRKTFEADYLMEFFNR